MTVQGSRTLRYSRYFLAWLLSAGIATIILFTGQKSKAQAWDCTFGSASPWTSSWPGAPGWPAVNYGNTTPIIWANGALFIGDNYGNIVKWTQAGGWTTFASFHLSSGHSLHGESSGINVFATNGTTLYVGGVFDSVTYTQGGSDHTNNVRNIAKCDLSNGTWSTVGNDALMDAAFIDDTYSGTLYEVMAPVQAIVALSSTNVYASVIDTEPDHHSYALARWNGSSWGKVGTNGISGTVFEYANSCPLTHDGIGTIFTLATDGTNIFVGGSFAGATNGATNWVWSPDIIKWCPASNLWVAMGATNDFWPVEADSRVVAMTICGTNIFVAGSIAPPLGRTETNSPGNLPDCGVYRYSTVAGGRIPNAKVNWYDSGEPGYVTGWDFPNGLTTMNGRVYFTAGTISNIYCDAAAVNVAASNIVQWDGNVWSPLGTGLSASGGSGMTTDGTNIYVVGNFTYAGPCTSVGVARWANSAPTVSITSPSNPTYVGEGTNLTITATASDSDGTIASVAFYDGSTLIGTDTSSPYSIAWNGVTVGWHYLTAVATDNNGTKTTSSVVSVYADQPMVSLGNFQIVHGPSTFGLIESDADDYMTFDVTLDKPSMRSSLPVALYLGSTTINDQGAPYASYWSDFYTVNAPHVPVGDCLFAVYFENGATTQTVEVHTRGSLDLQSYVMLYFTTTSTYADGYSVESSSPNENVLYIYP